MSLAIVFAIALGIAGYLFFWQNPSREITDAGKNLTIKEVLELRNNIRQTLAQVVAGTALIVGLFFTGWSIRYSQESLKLTRDNQITELFARALEQFDRDNNNSLAHQGALYSLERIARESKKDHWPIIQLMTAYVREKAVWQEERSQDAADVQVKPAPAIQAILTALGQRNTAFENTSQHIDLSKTDLRGAHMPDARLKRANLSETHLEGAILSGAHLEGADLWGAHLRSAYLGKAHLQKADLSNADLENTTLREANLKEANLRGAKLKAADFTEAKLTKARLQENDLEDVPSLTPEQIRAAHISKNVGRP